jgi:hypothetical protein
VRKKVGSLLICLLACNYTLLQMKKRFFAFSFPFWQDGGYEYARFPDSWAHIFSFYSNDYDDSEKQSSLSFFFFCGEREGDMSII